MLHIDIISCVPSLLEGPFSHSILARAQDKGLVSVHIHDLRAYGLGKHQQIDDYAYGGGAGMVMRVEPIVNCIEDLQQHRTYDECIFMTPDGTPLDQSLCNELSLKKNLIILAGHYKGVDERVREHLITREISIGDYVLSGGELPAAVLVDAIVRLLPGVLNDETSALSDSFQDQLLSPPVYTRPARFRDWDVPEILLSGHTERIEAWRHQQALQRTQEKRPDLFEKYRKG